MSTGGVGEGAGNVCALASVRHKIMIPRQTKLVRIHRVRRWQDAALKTARNFFILETSEEPELLSIRPARNHPKKRVGGYRAKAGAASTSDFAQTMSSLFCHARIARLAIRYCKIIVTRRKRQNDIFARTIKVRLRGNST